VSSSVSSVVVAMSSSVVTGGGGRRREWITVDELGLFDIVGDDGWIESNRIKSIVVNGWWCGMA